jgi:hypothetical protein
LTYGAEVWQLLTREINKMLSTEMDLIRRSARKSKMERTKNEDLKEIMPEERIPKLIMEWIPQERRKKDVQEKREWKE